MMTFNEAVTYLTRDGGSLLDELELIQDELDRANETDECPCIPIKDLQAFHLIIHKMRPLFA